MQNLELDEKDIAAHAHRRANGDGARLNPKFNVSNNASAMKVLSSSARPGVAGEPSSPRSVTSTILPRPLWAEPTMATHSSSSGLIELTLRDIQQLFNSMDPSPFYAKDLDGNAEAFIVNWAEEYPSKLPVTLRVHLEVWPATDPTDLIRDAVHANFANRAKVADLAFRRLMQRGRQSLLIGLVFLAACSVVSELLIRGAGQVGRYLLESLTIGGWVAMWRPMEIYLYDWWPIRREMRTFVKLSEMPVDVVRQVPAAAELAKELQAGNQASPPPAAARPTE